MTATDTLLRTALDRAKPLLDRLGILSAPLRDALDASRVITIDRPPEEVLAVIGEERTGATLFPAASGIQVTSAADEAVAWQLGQQGRATGRLRPGPSGATELTLEVHLDGFLHNGKPRYADNASVIAIRALHRAKSLLETGEVATLEHNPAGRSRPDPYAD